MPSDPVKVADQIRSGEDFELDLRAYELRRAGRPLKLERIPMALLFHLIEKRGHLVMRDQIIERIWGKDVFLDTTAASMLPFARFARSWGTIPTAPLRAAHHRARIPVHRAGGGSQPPDD